MFDLEFFSRAKVVTLKELKSPFFTFQELNSLYLLQNSKVWHEFVGMDANHHNVRVKLCFISF